MSEKKLITFSKMHGLGNDYIVFDESEKILIPEEKKPEIVEEICRRGFSVGADGVIFVTPATNEDADIRFRIFNPDGSEAEMCGNGIRCFARYVYDEGMVKKKEMSVSTLAGIIKPVLRFEEGRVSGVTVNMGRPVFKNDQIPVLSENPAMEGRVRVLGRDIAICTLLMGVPHTVVFMQKDEEYDPCEFGPAIETLAIFPKKTNVNFVRVLNQNTLHIT